MRFIEGGRPGDERGFIHKKILGGISTLAGIGSRFIPQLGVVSTVARALGGSRGKARDQKEFATQIKLADIGMPLAIIPRSTGAPRPIGFGGGRGGGGVCKDPRLVMAPDGHCVSPGSGHAAAHGIGDVPGTVTTPIGDPVMGRYGAGEIPGSMIIDRAVCRSGMQLGDDGVCYNKAQISNKQRMWPAGRKPLLSGGDMRAIGIAARAGRRLEGATKRLQRLGMMKKPARGRRSVAPPVHQRLLEAHVTK